MLPMLRLLLALCLATFTIPRTVDAAVELKSVTFTGQATASIDLDLVYGCPDNKAMTIEYQGQVSMEMNTRVEYRQGCEPGVPWANLPYLNVRFTLTTVDSAKIVTMGSSVETRMDIVRLESYAAAGGLWPSPIQFSCYELPAYYDGVQFPRTDCWRKVFGIQEFTTDGDAFRFGFRVVWVGKPSDGGRLGGVSVGRPTDTLGWVTITGVGVVPVIKSTWGSLKQQFVK
jgi:hypothetical protein